MKILKILTLLLCIPFVARAQNPEMAFKLLREGNGTMLAMLCDPIVTSQITIPQLSELWGQLESQMGKYSSHTQWGDHPGIKGVKFSNITFETGSAALLFSYTDDNKINGIQLTAPIAQPETSDGMDVTIVTDSRWKLRGKLSMPDNCDPAETPAVVLVHGSGPNDMDETLGPNAIFREIADSLSDRGIAVLRYDKRTYTYGPEAFTDPRKPTIKEECTDDAESAARILDSLGFKAIFIAGHSLGASLAPLIAYNDTTGTVTGIIMLAAPARDIEELVEDQLKVVGPFNTPEQIEALRSQIAGLDPEYKAQMDYDRKSVIRALVSSNFPILVIQGERDYQVTMKDFNLWKEWTGNIMEEESSYITFISYPDVNHILHKAEGTPSPLEYSKQGSIPSEIISDIAAFIMRNATSTTPVPSKAIQRLQE